MTLALDRGRAASARSPEAPPLNLLFSCIGRRGYIADLFRSHLSPQDRILGTGNTRWTPGFESCDAAFVLPAISDPDYVPAVLELCRRQRVDAVLSFSDPDVLALAAARRALIDEGVVPLLPHYPVAEIAADKLATHEFLTANGIASPRTFTHPSQAPDLAWPVYVKPRRGSASKGVHRARDGREMEFFLSLEEDMIIQEEVAGEELNIQLCNDLEGRPVALCAMRKHAMRQGETDQAETMRDPAVIELALRLGEALGAVGPVDIDVMREPDGRLVVLEANTRFGGAYPTAHLAGADFPGALLELVTDGKVSRPRFDYAEGVVMLKRLGFIGGPAARFFGEELGVRS